MNNKQDKPWGSKKDPVYIDPYLDENLLSVSHGQNYERGVWYYTGYPVTDHHDMCGVPSFFRDIQTLLGIQYRPSFYTNIYNRLRSLDFSDLPEVQLLDAKEIQISDISNSTYSNKDDEH